MSVIDLCEYKNLKQEIHSSVSKVCDDEFEIDFTEDELSEEEQKFYITRNELAGKKDVIFDLFYKDHNFNRALQEIKSMLKIVSPKEVDVELKTEYEFYGYVMLSACYNQLNNREKAIKAGEKAVKLSYDRRTKFDATWAMARLYEKQNKMKALKYYELCIESSDNDKDRYVLQFNKANLIGDIEVMLESVKKIKITEINRYDDYILDTCYSCIVAKYLEVNNVKDAFIVADKIKNDIIKKQCLVTLDNKII